jgi:hypothetical protein
MSNQDLISYAEELKKSGFEVSIRSDVDIRRMTHILLGIMASSLLGVVLLVACLLRLYAISK